VDNFFLVYNVEIKTIKVNKKGIKKDKNERKK